METTQKRNIETIAAKNRVIDNIIDAITDREHILLLGHKNPDEDCISSLVGFGLLISKFSKSPKIYLSVALPRQYHYLLNICKYNSITITYNFNANEEEVDTIAIIDTPKPSMVDLNSEIEPLLARPDIVKIEIDHHIGADSAYSGDPEYSLVTDASSAAELVGHIALKLDKKKELLASHQIEELFTRNLVLSLLTGIISDSNMGQFLKSRREQRYYKIFSSMFNTMLANDTVKDTNFADMTDIYKELTSLSALEEDCYRFFVSRKHVSAAIGYVVLTRDDTRKLYRRFDVDTVVSVSRTVVDTLAEESGRLGLVAYYDNPAVSDLVQFRLRRNRGYRDIDLRTLLTRFSIANGGGHEGAIGFRFPAAADFNIARYVKQLVAKIELIVDEAQRASDVQ